MITNGHYAALADHLAHGGLIGGIVYLACDSCECEIVKIQKWEEKVFCKGEDIVIERFFSLKCGRCGAVEYNNTFTVIPSWVYAGRYEHLRRMPL